jgi:hypothetical protein
MSRVHNYSLAIFAKGVISLNKFTKSFTCAIFTRKRIKYKYVNEKNYYHLIKLCEFTGLGNKLYIYDGIFRV